MDERTALASKSDLQRTQQILLHAFTSRTFTICLKHFSNSVFSAFLALLCSTPYANALPFFCLWQSIYPFCCNHPASLLFNNGEGKHGILVPAREETCLLGRDVTVLTACCTHGSHGSEHVLNHRVTRAAWLCISLAHCLNTNLIISVPKMHCGGEGFLNLFICSSSQCGHSEWISSFLFFTCHTGDSCLSLPW